MKDKKKKYSYYEQKYIFDNFVNRQQLEDVNSVEWGNKDHVKVSKKKYRNKELIIENRFDFGNDTSILIRNTKKIDRKLPNIFHLAKKQDFK